MRRGPVRLALSTGTLVASALLPAPALAAGPAQEPGSGQARSSVVVVDDRELTTRGTWTEVSASAAYADTLSKSVDRGARLTSPTSATDGGSVVVQVGPRRGKLAIWVGGVKKKTVATAATSKSLERVPFAGAGTVQVRVVEPRRGVFVDAVRLAQDEPPPLPTPGVGDLVINEVMADPMAVADEVGEWFEVVNVTDGPLDASGCLVTTQSAQTSSLTGAAAIPPGLFVLVRESDITSNGGVPADGTYALSMDNDVPGWLMLSCGAVQVDTAEWPTPSHSVGSAWSLDPAHVDAEANDLESSWCLASEHYGDGDWGSPGAANPACTNPVPPVAGDVVVTEVLADPTKVSDTDGEWFEMLSVADHTLDLTGCVLSNLSGASSPVFPTDLAAGDGLVLAHNTNFSLNGGVMADMGFSFALTNTTGSITLTCGDVVVDTVSWTTTTAGTARSLDPAFNDAALNDGAEHWCLATTPYGLGDLGTPGGANPACS